MEKTLDTTKLALLDVSKELDLREEVIKKLEELKKFQGETINTLEMKVNKFETTAKCAKELGCENKILKSTNSELNGDIKAINKEAKILKKEMKQMEHDFMKKSDSLEGKMKSLAEFKAEKLAEQKDFQSKEKLLKKQIKTFEEKKQSLVSLEKSWKEILIITRLIKSQYPSRLNITLTFPITSHLHFLQYSVPIFATELLQSSFSPVPSRTSIQSSGFFQTQVT